MARETQVLERLESTVRLEVGGVQLEGSLAAPEEIHALVLFAHGAGSSRHSPRNRFVADTLARAGLGTLLMDLLTADEEARDAETAELRFDIALLAERLIGAVDWLARDPRTQGLSVGCFGASTGAAAALEAAAARGERVKAVVSRGGRPDLAPQALPQVNAPTLLIVGGDDPQVIELNEQAKAALRAPSRLEIVPGAGHLFEEPGALERVAELARDWFREHLRPLRTAGPANGGPAW